MSKERKRGEDRLDVITRAAKEMLLTHGFHLPTVIAFGIEGNAALQIEAPPEGADNRALVMKVLGSQLYRQKNIGQLRSVIFVSEGWFSDVQGKENPVLPSQDPDRRECLVVSEVKVPDKKTTLIMYEMVRNEGGDLIRIADLNLPQGDATSQAPIVEAFIEGYQTAQKKAMGILSPTSENGNHLPS